MRWLWSWRRRRREAVAARLARLAAERALRDERARLTGDEALAEALAERLDEFAEALRVAFGGRS